MTLNITELEFPNNVAHLLKAALKVTDPDTPQQEGVRIYGRPLNPTDDTMSMSVVPTSRVPDLGSKEMIGRRRECIFQDYTIVIQGLIIESDEESGIILSGKFASRIYNTLLRDEALEAVLPGLSFTYTNSPGLPDARETVMKYDVVKQNFINNTTDSGKFVFLSETEFTFRTQIV